ncbi:hypothetical protein HPB51_006099 [Rhipicephalus microplus]|uniref:Uncharacterized protein n=1 Tax=Rhipicephalus microplus TaxID=6941 RepID=A0A9J6ER25_RHIMP|nr:hypothetical protein HPB51_006099 [Rhipicephalus microplus]
MRPTFLTWCRSYKSDISLDKLYPSSGENATQSPPLEGGVNMKDVQIYDHDPTNPYRVEIRVHLDSTQVDFAGGQAKTATRVQAVHRQSRQPSAPLGQDSQEVGQRGRLLGHVAMHAARSVATSARKHSGDEVNVARQARKTGGGSFANSQGPRGGVEQRRIFVNYCLIKVAL